MSNQMATAEAVILGGWTQYRPLTEKDQKVFNEAMKGIIGVIYNPLEVSIQIVNGTNFRFKCSASIPSSELIYAATVDIHEAIGGTPEVTDIHMTPDAKKNQIPGGWSKNHPLTDEERMMFDEAISKNIGITYDPKLVSVQIVNGTNYRYQCEASMPPAMLIWRARVDIYKPNDGTPVITEIIRE